MKLLLPMFIVMILVGCRQDPTGTVQPGDYQRIVTLAPSLSESVFALGLGDRVVGVTAFADYPPSVTNLPKIGGYSEINIEAVYALEPDLVVALDQQSEIIRRLESLNIKTASFSNTSLPSIIDMLQGLGKLLDRQEQAEQHISAIQSTLDALAAEVAGLPQRRVLVSVGRNMGTGSIGDVYVAGSKTIYGEIIERIGADNVYRGPAPYTVLSHEAIMRLNPDVILDLIPNLESIPGYSKEDALAQWQVFDTVKAVTNQHVTICSANYICIPGPRVGMMIRDLAHSIYPELKIQP